MKHQFFTVAKREFTKTIKQKSFWIATLILPIFMVVIGFISGYSATVAENKMKESISNAKSILVINNSTLLNNGYFVTPFELTSDKETSIEKVKDGSADALIVFPNELDGNDPIEIYQQDNGIFNNARYSSFPDEIIKLNILSQLNDSQKIQIFNATRNIKTVSYKDGIEVSTGFESFVLPIGAMIIYFMLIIFSSSYLLMSVSEEKENRIMETLLSTMKSKDLITGKLLGQIFVSITQISVLIILTAIPAYIFRNNIPFDLSSIKIDFTQLLPSIYFTICGYLILANAMIGLGSATPNYKDAGGYTSFFIILSILPLYFITILLSEPHGMIAIITSYIPITSSMVLLIRSALGELKGWEMALSMIVTAFYVYLSFLFAFKTFELGALEYSKVIDFKNIFKKKS